MSQFILKIELGNSAMCFPKDIADVLKRIATDVHYTDMNELVKHPVNIRDYNGNKVGFYQVE